MVLIKGHILLHAFFASCYILFYSGLPFFFFFIKFSAEIDRHRNTTFHEPAATSRTQAYTIPATSFSLSGIFTPHHRSSNTPREDFFVSYKIKRTPSNAARDTSTSVPSRPEGGRARNSGTGIRLGAPRCLGAARSQRDQGNAEAGAA